MSSVSVQCRCGQVRGRLEEASPETVNRVVCMCTDCQAFVHHLGREDLLDAHGGTDIVQVAPGRLHFHQGNERIVGLRLTPKGLYRFYADCCKTPLGNTVGPALPFVGIVVQAFEHPDETFGPPIGKIFGKSAIGTPPPGSEKLSLRMLVRVLRLVLGWRLRGKGWPHPFFDRGAKTPNRPITTLSTSERRGPVRG